MDELTITQEWFEKAVPNPTNTNLSIQIGCFFEEVSEVADALSTATKDTSELAKAYKQGEIVKPNVRELLDGLADTIVTAVGVCHMLGVDASVLLNRINTSNYSKFEDDEPVFKNGKISKGKHYREPFIDDLVEKVKVPSWK